MQISKNTPDPNDMFIICVRGTDIMGAESFNNLGGRSSIPVAFDFFIAFKRHSTSEDVTG